MKKAFALLLTLCLLFSLSSCMGKQSALDMEHYIDYTVPEGLLVMKPGDLSQCREVLETFNMKDEDAETYMHNNSILVTTFVQDSDAEGKNSFPVEMFLTVNIDRYAQNIWDLARLSPEEQERNMKMFVDADKAEEKGYYLQELKLIDNGEYKYIMYDYHTKTEGEDGVTQYVSQYMTIFNGNVYCFSCVANREMTEEEKAVRDAFFQSVHFTKRLEPIEDYDPEFNALSKAIPRMLLENWPTVLIVVAAIAALIVYIVFRRKKKDGGSGGGGGNDKNKPVRAQYLS